MDRDFDFRVVVFIFHTGLHLILSSFQKSMKLIALVFRRIQYSQEKTILTIITYERGGPVPQAIDIIWLIHNKMERKDL